MVALIAAGDDARPVEFMAYFDAVGEVTERESERISLILDVGVPNFDGKVSCNCLAVVLPLWITKARQKGSW